MHVYGERRLCLSARLSLIDALMQLRHFREPLLQRRQPLLKCHQSLLLFRQPVC
jgi:hypothetical protein